MKPATSSDSASTRSKGGRLVSARAEMKKITNIGRSGSQYQPRRPKRESCALTISSRFSEPTQSRTVIEHEADRDFVGDHLRRRAQRREKRIFRVRRPAAHDDAIDGERRDRENVENADIDVGDAPAFRDRNDRPGGKRQKAGKDRRQQEQALVRAVRNHRLLQHEFDQVGEALPQAPGTDDIRPATQLHRRPDLAVGEKDVSDEDQQNDEKNDALQKGQQKRAERAMIDATPPLVSDGRAPAPNIRP